MSAGRWLAALRIARRDVLRDRARSLLVIALVGLPVLLLAGADVLYRTSQLSPTQTLNRQIGTADALLTWNGEPGLTQSPSGDSAGSPRGFDPDHLLAVPDAARLRASLPTGSRVIPYRTGEQPLTFLTPAGLDRVPFVGLNYADPLASGIVRQIQGRAPTTAAEVALTSRVARDTGLGVGSLVRATDPRRTFRVVGIVEGLVDHNASAIYALPRAVPRPTINPLAFAPIASDGWLVRTPAPVSWAAVQRLNSLGWAVTSRQVYLAPPAVAEESASSSVPRRTLAGAVLVGGLVLIEIVLLAGPAFAAGAKRRARDLALVAATGGSSRDLRRVVLADAVLLGVTAGVLGAGLGAGAGALAVPLFARWYGPVPGPLDVPWPQIGALALVGMVTALVAALVPAIRASHVDVTASLSGRHARVSAGKIWPAVGAICVALGLVLALSDSASASAVVLLAGLGLIELGVIVATPALIALIALGARRLPTSGRIALRDAGRNRVALAPSVAAVLACVVGAVAVAVVAAANRAQQERAYTAALPHRDTYVALNGHPGDAPAISATLRHNLPGATITPAYGIQDECGPADTTALESPCFNLGLWNGGLPRPDSAALPWVLVSDGHDIDQLFGTAVPTVSGPLAAGRVVLINSDVAPSARAHLAITHAVSGGLVSRQPRVSASYVTLPWAPTTMILPFALAHRLKLRVTVHGVLATNSSTLGARQNQALALAVWRTGHSLTVYTETGFVQRNAVVSYVAIGVAGLLAVLAALLASALSAAEARADLAVLSAVGAAPRTRRVLAMARAAVIASLGTIIGAAAGLVPAVVWLRANSERVTIPWLLLIALVVGIPVVTAAVAGLVTRDRLPGARFGAGLAAR